MKKISNLLIVTFFVLAGCKSSQQSTNSSTKSNSQPVIAQYGPFNIYTPEFEYVYKKNNANSMDAYTKSSIDEYLQLYINFRLKVQEAQEMGMDTSSAFKKELEGYQKQLAQPYLTEKGVTEQLCREAYDRMKEEINASHILLELSPDADPADTLKIYNKIIEIRQKAISGQDFGKLAQENSQDPSAKTNKGNLGYFTALQMVYPFEDMAYKTKVGEISMPVRTRFGYHILKIHNKRPSQGQVKVAHIMVRATTGISAADSLAAKQKADEIFKKAKSGEKWETLVSQFTDDVNSKNKGGELPWFSTGRMIGSFEDASFALKNIGDISEPVQTPYGWHIIKLLEKKNLETYQELEAGIKSKVQKDSRSELNKTVLLQRLKKENNYSENNKAIEAAVQMADSTLLTATFFKKTEDKTNLVLFTIKDQAYKTADFITYVRSVQKTKKGISPAQLMRNYFKDYSNAMLMAYEESHLEEKYIDYKMLVREYRDGILLFQLMDDKVWSKAIEDTAGLKAYFNANNDKYKWDARAQATIFNCNNKATLEKLKIELGKEIFPVNDPKVNPVNFEKNKFTITEELKRKIDQTIPAMVKDKSLILEITGLREFSENNTVSKLRADSAKAYLVARGINENRIKTADAGKAPLRKKEEEKTNDRKITFAFYSNSTKALEPIFNASAPLTLQVTEGLFQKGEQAALDSIEWKPGSYTIETDGRINYIIIKKIEAPRNRNFDEARGLTISDYQNYLEKTWIEALKKKYPVIVFPDEINKLLKK